MNAKNTGKRVAKAAKPATVDEIRKWPAAVGLKMAARALGIGMTKAYELARADTFPVRLLPLGGTYRVPTADLMEYLGIKSEATSGDSAA